MAVNSPTSDRRGPKLVLLTLPALCVIIAGCAGSSGSRAAVNTCGEMPFAALPPVASAGDIRLDLKPVARVAHATSAVIEPASGDVFVSARNGHIWRVVDDAPAAVWANMSAEIATSGDEQGLLDLTLSADGSAMYVAYTARADNALVVDELDTHTATRAQTLLRVPKQSEFHNGGGLVVAPDGRLLVGIGDDNPPDVANDARSQNSASPYGKIIEIDPAEPTAPPHNVALGLRNPWRFSLDADGSTWIGDVGERCAEEINHVPGGAASPPNFGWPLREGTLTHQHTGDTATLLVDPVFAYSHEPRCAIVVGPLYRGAAIPALDGQVLFGDYCTGEVFALDPTAGTALRLPVDGGQVTSFASLPDGEVLLVTDQGVAQLIPR